MIDQIKDILKAHAIDCHLFTENKLSIDEFKKEMKEELGLDNISEFKVNFNYNRKGLISFRFGSNCFNFNALKNLK